MTRAGAKDGYILVAVLGVMLLLTSLVAGGSMFIRSALDTVKVSNSDGRMSGLSIGGLELAAYQLFVIKASPELIDGRRIKFSDGSITPHILDESGKADLNTSDPKLLASIFRSIGMNSQATSEAVARIVEFRGTEKDQTNLHGGATSVATQSQQDDKKRRRGFQSVDDLGEILRLSHADFKALRPHLTVYNPDGKINILSASSETLAALPGVSAADVEVILARRKGASKRDADNLSNLLEKAKEYIKTKSGPAYTVRVDAISTAGRKKAINAVVAAAKGPTDPFYVLDWWE